jgi:WD40 repeat protein/transcriptional regulator with XRE-family HTH domain
MIRPHCAPAISQSLPSGELEPANVTAEPTPTFGESLRRYRAMAGLTQEELAARSGLTPQGISLLERGERRNPQAHTVHNLADALGLADEERARFAAAARRSSPLGTVISADTTPAAGSKPPPPTGDRAVSERTLHLSRQHDWGEAPDVATFYGRELELERLEHWLLVDRCRLVALVGMGGIGKTVLATRLAHQLAPHFDCVFWRSLGNALPFETWLADAVQFVSAQQTEVPGDGTADLAPLLDLLRGRRCLIVLDNWETVLTPGDRLGLYRSGFEPYGQLLRLLGGSSTQSSLLVTSREEPAEVGLLAGAHAAVRSFRLGGLGEAASQAILLDKGLHGDAVTWRELVERYGGNALALKMAGQTIGEVFGGDIAAFLAYATATFGAVFGGIRRLLDQQFARLSPMGQTLLYWLAISRAVVSLDELVARLAPGAKRADVLESLEGLRRRSLIERGQQAGTFTLQPVVLEYVTDRLVENVSQEIERGEPLLLASHALLLAQARDHLRQAQERLILVPILEQLGQIGRGEVASGEQQLLRLLQAWQERPQSEHGYGPGNVVNLLRTLRGNLCGLDLSGLAIRQAYLQDAELQDTILAGSQLSDALLSESLDSVLTLALNADGSLLVAGTLGGRIHVWSLPDRLALLDLQAERGAVYGVAISADGSMVASGGLDGTVKLWDVHSGQCISVLTGHTGIVQSVSLSADGGMIASGGSDATVRLWDSRQGRCLASLHGHGGWVQSVALSRDGRMVTGGGQDGQVRLWDTGSGECLSVLQAHSGWIQHLAISAHGEGVVSTGQDGTLQLWNARTGHSLAIREPQTEAICAVALSADGTTLAGGGQDGQVTVWDTAESSESARPRTLLPRHAATISAVAISADGCLLAGGSLDGVVRVWDPRSEQCLATMHGYTGWVYGVALSASGHLVAGCGNAMPLTVWDAATGQARATLQGHTGLVYRVAMDAAGRLLATAGQDGTLGLWDANGAARLATLRGHGGPVYAVALSAGGHLVTSGGDDATIKVWDPHGGTCLATLEAHGGPVYAVALSGDGRLLASGSQDGMVRLWDTGPYHSQGRPAVTPAAPGGGQCLATLVGHTGLVYDVAISADGDMVASGGEDCSVRLWDTWSGACLAILQGHAGWVLGVALSRDGQVLASGDQRGALRIWDPSDAQCLAVLEEHTAPIWSVALSADGRLLASGSQDGTVRLWDVRGATCICTLRHDRPYERLDITGVTGLTGAQKTALKALGAVERGD